MTWQFTLTGLLIGGLVGLTGMGGGSLLTPILVIVFGFKPTYAVGTDILHGAIFKSFGAVRHRRLGTVHARLVFWMFLGSGPMSLLGVTVATWLKHRYGDGVQSVEAYAIGAALILGGLGLIAKTFVKIGVQPDDAPFILSRRDRVIAVTIGAVFGFVVGLTSVGSGTFFGLVMVLVYPLTLPKIVGTDIFHAMSWLLLGSIPGVLLTSQLTLRLPDRALRLGLATVLMLSGVKLVNLPGADWIVLAGFIVGGIVFTAWGVHELRARRAEERRQLATDLTLS